MATTSAKKPTKRGAAKKTRKDGSIVYDIPDMCKRIAEYLESPFGYQKLLDADGHEVLDKNGNSEMEWRVPQLYEVFRKNGWTGGRVSKLAGENEDLAEALQEIRDAKLYWTERGGLAGKIPATPAVFAMKQLGCTDTPTTTVQIKLSTETEKYAK